MSAIHRTTLLGLASLLVCSPALSQVDREDFPVYRAQLRLRLCNVANAGTDNDVRIKLNDDNSTWLNYARDDFERNSDFTYDLSLGAVGRFRDVRMLRVAKTGTNGMCIRSLGLLLNDRLVFSKAYGSGHWLDTQGSRSNELLIQGTEVRSAGEWQSYALPSNPSLTISNGELESRIESAVGDALRRPGAEQVQWGRVSGEAVQAYYISSRKVGVDLDLMAVVNNWPDQTVDVEFKLVVSCSQGQIAFDIEDFDAKVRMGLFSRSADAILKVARSAGVAISTLTGTALQGALGGVAGLAIGLAAQAVPEQSMPAGGISLPGITTPVCPETLEVYRSDLQGLLPRGGIRIAYSPEQILEIARQNGWLPNT